MNCVSVELGAVMQRRGWRQFDSSLAWTSLALLLIYAPLETYVSWPEVSSPGYLCDVIAFALLGFGGWYSLSKQPLSGLGPLCADWGFCACLGWRSYFNRVISRERGASFYVGEPEYVQSIVGAATIVAFVMLAACLFTAIKRDHSRDKLHPRP